MGRPKEVTDEQIIEAARRCFIERGTGVSALEIAKELGVSHTTLFNRFGSKEALLVAALTPRQHVPWIATLEEGPDEKRPIREQLVAHAKVMAAFFQELQAGLGVLQAAGVAPKRQRRGKDEPPAVQALHALVAWLKRAQHQGRLGPCDTETLASTILGALHGWAFTARACGAPTTPAASERYVERFIELLWNGIGADAN